MGNYVAACPRTACRAFIYPLFVCRGVVQPKTIEFFSLRPNHSTGAFLVAQEPARAKNNSRKLGFCIFKLIFADEKWNKYNKCVSPTDCRHRQRTKNKRISVESRRTAKAYWNFWGKKTWLDEGICVRRTTPPIVFWSPQVDFDEERIDEDESVMYRFTYLLSGNRLLNLYKFH